MIRNNYEYQFSRNKRIWICQSLNDGTIWFFNSKADVLKFVNDDIGLNDD
jgi:hypothetical protein